jgi:hypothetical protein
LLNSSAVGMNFGADGVFAFAVSTIPLYMLWNDPAGAQARIAKTSSA